MLLCIAILISIVPIGYMLGIYDTGRAFEQSADELVSKIQALGDVFTKLSDYASDVNSTGLSIVADANSFQCSNGSSAESAALSLVSQGEQIVSAATILSTLAGDPASKCFLAATEFESNGRVWLEYYGYPIAEGMVALFTLYTVLIFFGALCCQGRTAFAFIGEVSVGSTTSIAFGNFLGPLMMLVIAAVLCGSLATGISIADFCAAGPARSLNAVSADVFGTNSDTTRTIQFYTGCAGTNPFAAYYDDIVDSTSNISRVLNVSQTALVSCNRSSFNSVQTLNDNLVSASGPVQSFSEASKCPRINSMVSDFLNEELCTDLVQALCYLALISMPSLFSIYVVMFVSSFARQILFEESEAYEEERQAKRQEAKENRTETRKLKAVAPAMPEPAGTKDLAARAKVPSPKRSYHRKETFLP